MNTAVPQRALLAGARICLVTSAPLGSNPRLVKEANALQAAGAQVRVVATDVTGLAVVRERSEHVLRTARWTFDPVDTGGVAARRLRAVQRRAARALWAAGLRGDALACRALDPVIPRIARTAAREPADLYIAHNLPALPAAAAAARRQGARLGFDAEDFHSGQLLPSERLARGFTEAIERRYLPACDHLTAASPGIAAAYARLCAIPPPAVILNVFPRDMAPPHPSAQGLRPGGRPSLYWFSQTVGPGRGLEPVFAAVARSRARPVLALQGSVQPAYRQALESLARSHGLTDHLVFLPPAPPDELARIAARHDAGLATETDETVNRDICLTNKVFTYLLGGVPVLASATSAQLALAGQWPGAMWALPLDDPQAWADRIDALLLAPGALSAARHAAWQAAQSRLHWEHEAVAFVNRVAACLHPAS